MHVEVSVALNFVISYLYNKLPRRRVDMFGEEMDHGLKRKFQGHWYDDKPFKGSAYRCIRVSSERVEPVIELAASMSQLDINEILEYLPRDLTVWIDPGEVSYRIGEKGVVKVLYSSRQTNDGLHNDDREITDASKGFNPDAQCFKPIDSLSSSLSNLSVSPGTTSPSTMAASATINGNLASGATSPWAAGSVSPIAGNHNSTSPLSAGSSIQNGPVAPTPPINSFLNRNTNSTMTTAMFAQTKFGSTKLKNQAKRPSRLSPTEVGAYFKQRNSPQSLASPSGAPMGMSPFPTGNRGQAHPLSPGNTNLTRGPGNMLPNYAMDKNHVRAGFPPFYMLPQQGPPPSSSGQIQGGHAAPLLSDIYNPILPGPFTPSPQQPATSYGNRAVNMPRFQDVFPVSSSAQHGNEAVSSGSNMSPNSPSPDGGLSNRSFLDGLNYNNLPNYQTLQHMLVAN